LEKQIAEDAACEAAGTCEAESEEGVSSSHEGGDEDGSGNEGDEPEWEAPDADDEPAGDDDDDDDDDEEEDVAGELD
jgi:hypothetical protein